MIFYKLDLMDGDTEMLKQSISAYQSALHVFTQAQAPQRWGEIKDGLGQALQVWGDIARNQELLERAVASCRDALTVRSREQMPLLWAASQNNLGSALFLLGRMTEKTEHIEGAAEAFKRALSVYKREGADGMAAVTEKNMAKAETLLKGRVPRSTGTPGREPGRQSANDLGPPPRPNKRVSSAGH